jgi:hypothetical protein
VRYNVVPVEHERSLSLIWIIPEDIRKYERHGVGCVARTGMGAGRLRRRSASRICLHGGFCLCGRLYANKPLDFLFGLLDDVRAGGLSSSLRNWGWINSIDADEYGTFQGTTIVSIDVDLTLLGFLHVEDVATMIFAFLRNIVTQLDGNDIDSRAYDELRTMGSIDFNFLDNSGAASTVQVNRP